MCRMLVTLVSQVAPIWIGVIAFAVLMTALLILRGIGAGRPHS